MQVQSLGREDALEKEMATHSSILAWKFRGWAVPHSDLRRKESTDSEYWLSWV